MIPAAIVITRIVIALVLLIASLSACDGQGRDATGTGAVPSSGVPISPGPHGLGTPSASAPSGGDKKEPQCGTSTRADGTRCVPLDAAESTAHAGPIGGTIHKDNLPSGRARDPSVKERGRAAATTRSAESR